MKYIVLILHIEKLNSFFSFISLCLWNLFIYIPGI